MSIKVLIRLFLVCFAFFAFFWLFNWMFSSKTIGEFEKEVSDNSKIQNQIDNLILEDNLLINESGDTLSMRNLISGNKLIMRFSELNCNSCVINEFENLKSAMDKGLFGNEDIIIITYYQNPNYLNMFKRINKLDEFEIYNLVQNKVGEFKLDEMSIPFFFILNEDLKISHAFIPMKVLNIRTDEYFNEITSVLGSKT